MREIRYATSAKHGKVLEEAPPEETKVKAAVKKVLKEKLGLGRTTPTNEK